MINKYGTALILGAVAGVSYVLFAGSFDLSNTLTVAGGIFGLVLLAALGKDLCRHPSNLGDLNEERPTLIGALMFTAIFTSYQVYQTVFTVDPAPEPLWIHDHWGVEGRCEAPLKIGPGTNERELAIETGGERHTRRVLTKPTENKVTTDGGAFELLIDGNMTSTVPGYAGSTFERCPK